MKKFLKLVFPSFDKNAGFLKCNLHNIFDTESIISKIVRTYTDAHGLKT